MCGITGILNLDGEPVAPRVLRAMADAVRHRGPDGEGTYVDGALGFGHRRLAIIDRSPAAEQPMATRDGRFVLTYNGEVYNFQELRRELEARGWGFRSRGDTEVVLYALAEWGVQALERFNGMFALALWDTEREELLLARDRYGIKPLYWHRDDRRVLFGSEIKALLAHPEVRPSVDPRALLEYFTFQNLFTRRTLFDGVELLPPGSFVRIGVAGVGPVQTFWDFDFREPDGDAGRIDEREYLEELDRLFRQAVNRQLVADVPIGSYLSGGMDSGSITAVAAPQFDTFTSFTVGFDLSSASGIELAFDERTRAERMSYLFGTEHYEMVLKAGDLERVMPALTWHLEDLRVGQCYPNYYAARLASKFVTVVLSGAGGDELFGGYPWRYYRAVVNDSFDDYVGKYYGFWQRLLPPDAIDRVFAPIRAEVADVDTRAIFADAFATHAPQLTRPEDYINHSLYLEARTFLHGLLLVEDKLSMAHSLETRLPFLDNDLVDFAQAVPVGLKLGNLGEVVRLDENEPGWKTERFFNNARDGKLILRQAMERHVPADVTGREKQGFAAPDASWFRGESIDYVRRRLVDGDARIYGYLDRDEVLALVDDHLAGRENRRLLIWSLLSVEEWLQTFAG
ncbi:asparagine synthase (glutamine-hydrolyzing) [Capillimicrobium parvum]|uniref:asparagine synthase (glutamine-hydrolyzing) n=1 Tax=Capillimicrobium parvum TaxID=2884022 RepID=A0A9E7C692_9ACTN|nr:asparagine synthase (glutamine-hydrolyzing) [Capillimicrobium parvum]UGS38697.1 Asparagine synthetase [glutamine-hydrolyzing] 1 [Capillimicrobium parvum]